MNEQAVHPSDADDPFTPVEHVMISRRTLGWTQAAVKAKARKNGTQYAELIRRVREARRAAPKVVLRAADAEIGRSVHPEPPRRIRTIAAPTPAVDPASSSDSIRRRLERLLRAGIAEAETSPPADPEAAGRALAIHVRSYAALRRIEGGADDRPDAAPARTLSQLRDELRERLQRLWERGRAAGGGGGPSPH